MTKEQFTQYVVDVKGYDKQMVNDALQEMKEYGTPVQDFLSEEELAECITYNA